MNSRMTRCRFLRRGKIFPRAPFGPVIAACAPASPSRRIKDRAARGKLLLARGAAARARARGNRCWERGPRAAFRLLLSGRGKVLRASAVVVAYECISNESCRGTRGAVDRAVLILLGVSAGVMDFFFGYGARCWVQGLGVGDLGSDGIRRVLLG